MSPPAASPTPTTPGPTLLSVKVLPVMTSVSLPTRYSAAPLSLTAFEVKAESVMATSPAESEKIWENSRIGMYQRVYRKKTPIAQSGVKKENNGDEEVGNQDTEQALHDASPPLQCDTPVGSSS